MEQDDTGKTGATAAAGASATSGRKVKFMPNVPTRRGPKKISAVKTESEDPDSESALPDELRQTLLLSQAESAARAASGRGAGRGGARRAPIAPAVRVSFGHGLSFTGPPQATSRHASFGAATDGSASTSSRPGSGAAGTSAKLSAEDLEMRSLLAEHNRLNGGAAGPGSSLHANGIVEDEEAQRLRAHKRAKAEPDYSRYYPVSLPLRPSTGDGAELAGADGVSHAQEATGMESEARNQVPAAQELGLQELSQDPRLLFFQLPSVLPRASDSDSSAPSSHLQSMSSRGEGTAGAGKQQGEQHALNQLPAGHVGKMRVYDDGSVHLVLGDIVLEASPGSRAVFHQELMAADTEKKECHFLGPVQQRIVLLPDLDSLLGDSSKHKDDVRLDRKIKEEAKDEPM